MKMTDEELGSYLARVYLLMHRRMNRAMTAQGASLARTKVLFCIEKQGTTRAADIAEILDQTPRTITEVLDSLERDDLIERHPDPDDRRVKRLTITPAGERAIAATEPLRCRIISEIFDVLTGGEKEMLGSALIKLFDRLSSS